MKILRILLSAIMIFVMCLPNLTVFGAADAFPKAVLSTATATENRLDVWAGESKVTPSLETKDGKTGWITDIKNAESAKNIYCDVADSYLYNSTDGAAVEITVEYFDSSAGLFSVVYNSVTGTDEAVKPVELKGTNTWKTHTFRFYNAKFANGYKGADFAVKTYYTTDGTHKNNEYHNMYFVAGDIVFGSISVKKIPLIAKIETGMPGNIFFGTGDRLIPIYFENTTDSKITTSVSYEVISLQTNSVVWNSSNIVVVAAKGTAQKTINIPIDKYGPFVLKISSTANGDAIATEREFNYSVVVDNSGLPKDYRVGYNVHPWDTSYGGTYKDTLADLLDKTGVGWIRTALLWSKYEKTPGNYVIPADVMAAIDATLEKGIKPIIILHGTNSNYAGAEEFPVVGEGLVAFEKYCENLARDLKGKVDVFESWNEYNNQSTDAEHYMALLKATYNGIKRGNPDATLVGFDTGAMNFDWMETIAKAGGMPYMDAISVHPYSVLFPDEYLPERMQKVKDFAVTYGDNDEEVWATEIGWTKVRNKWYTGRYIEDFGEVGAAASLVKTYVHCIGRDIADKILYYEFMDSGYQYASKEGNFGVIESFRPQEVTPYAAKPEYIASAFMTNRLHNANPDGYTFNNNNYVYKFVRKDGSSVDVAWNVNKNGYVKLNLPDAGYTTVYDFYGNEITSLDNTVNDSYNLQLGETPVYVEYTDGTGSAGPEITYSIDSSKKEATITAQLTADDAGAVASLFVMRDGSSFDNLGVNPMKSVVYVSQGEVDDNGVCSVTFAIPDEAGVYNAYLAFEGYNDRYELDIMVTKEFTVVLTVTQNDTIISDMSGLDKNKDMKVNIKGYNVKENLSDIKLIYAFYDGEVLSSVNVSDVSKINNEFSDSVTVTAPLNGGKSFNSIKVFAWEDFENISGVCKNLHIK